MIPFSVIWVALCTCTARLQSPPSESQRESAVTDVARAKELDELARAERTAGRTRRDRIRAELKDALDGKTELPRWAGEFSTSRGSFTVALAPKAGMTACRSIDVVGTDRWNHGEVVSSNDRSVEVKFALPIDALGSPLGPRFHVVSWERFDFLVSEQRLVEYCDSFNHEAGMFLRARLFARFAYRDAGGPREPRADDHERLPAVPAEFSEYFLDRAVTGHVTAVDAPRRCGEYSGGVPKFETVVTVDVGREQKLLPGMSLELPELKGFGEGEIFDSLERSCRVAFRHSQSDRTAANPITVGALVSTGFDRTPR